MRFTQEQRRLLWLSKAEISADHLRNMLARSGTACALWDDFANGIAIPQTSRRTAC